MTSNAIETQLNALCGGLPLWPDDSLRRQIHTERYHLGETLVVIDDDPTGCQTVYDVPLLLSWTVEELSEELIKTPVSFFVLTNSRAFPTSWAAEITYQVAKNLLTASKITGKGISVLSRSDSTLRGHFPVEIEVLNTVLGPYDGVLIAPYFGEGGRITVEDTHYIRDGESLKPVGSTPFANDPVFGYRSSDLRQWVVEKAGRIWSIDDVLSISISDIRSGGPQAILGKLLSISSFQPVIVNAASDRDLEVVALALLSAAHKGKRILPRSAASLVKVMIGLDDHPLLNQHDLSLPDSGHGGLVVVGSYVPQTTTQLDCLLQLPGVVGVELNVTDLLTATDTQSMLAQTRRTCEQLISGGETAVLYTSRALVGASGGRSSLEIGRTVVDALSRIVMDLESMPAFLVAKGGITSFELARSALGCRKATVLGQILPGVPVWRLERARKFSRLPFIVFPGNVGGDDALRDAVASLQ